MGRDGRLPAVPLRPAARRPPGASWSAAATSRSAGCPALLAAGADVVRRLAARSRRRSRGWSAPARSTWVERGFADDDLDGAWYVIAATDDPAVNEQVSAAAEERADLLRARRRRAPRRRPGPRPSAGTPGSRVAVLGNREPRRSAAVRDAIVDRPARGHDRRAGTSADRARRAWCWSAAGPGDPELISVAGRRALMEADVVVADRLAPRELLGELPGDVELVDVAKLPRGRVGRSRRRSTG